MVLTQYRLHTCCEIKVIELKHHAALVYENVLFAEGRTLTGFQVTFKVCSSSTFVAYSHNDYVKHIFVIPQSMPV
jgi:hypothetical protein